MSENGIMKKSEMIVSHNITNVAENMDPTMLYLCAHYAFVLILKVYRHRVYAVGES
jgi:hypothetical protein